MAVEALKPLAFRVEAPAARVGRIAKIGNITNHMRQADGGAFILPS
jgi:hypothetical protein